MKTVSKLFILLSALLVLGLGVSVLLKEPDTLSLSERRDLKGKPALTIAAVSDGSYFSDAEDYLLDQFPFRDGFRRLKAYCACYLFGQKDNHGIVIRDGSAAQLGSFPTEKDLSTFVRRIQSLCETWLQPLNISVYTSLIPDKMAFLTDVGYPTGDYGALQSTLSEELPGVYTDIFPELSLGDYYSTDSHWRQEEIIPAANALLSAMGRRNMSSYSLSEPYTPFYGVYYGESALPLKPDVIRTVHSEVIDSAAVRRAAARTVELTESSVYYPEAIGWNDPYDIYLGGARGIIALKNTCPAPEAEGKVLCLFSDSFGRSLAPLLLEGYSEVIVYDLRYMSMSFSQTMLPLPENADALIIYSVGAVAESANLKTD